MKRALILAVVVITVTTVLAACRRSPIRSPFADPQTFTVTTQPLVLGRESSDKTTIKVSGDSYGKFREAKWLVHARLQDVSDKLPRDIWDSADGRYRGSVKVVDKNPSYSSRSSRRRLGVVYTTHVANEWLIEHKSPLTRRFMFELEMLALPLDTNIGRSSAPSQLTAEFGVVKATADQMTEARKHPNAYYSRQSASW